MSATFHPAPDPTRPFLKARIKGDTYYNTEKPERSLRTKDWDEAVRAYDQQAGRTPPERGDIRCREAFEFWIDNSGKDTATIKLWKDAWEIYCARFLDGWLVSEVDVKRIIKVKNAAEIHVSTKTKQVVSAGRVDSVLTMLSSFFNAQTKLPTKYRDDNPVADLGGLRAKRKTTRPVSKHEVLSREQVDLLIECVQIRHQSTWRDILFAKQMRLLILILVFGGMRIGEALALHLDDLEEDGDLGEWKIEKQVDKFRDPEDPDTWFKSVKGETEGGQVGDSVRYVPIMNADLREQIDAYIAEGLEGGWLKQGGLLFPTTTGTPRLVTGADERFRRIRDLAGLTTAKGRRKTTVLHHLRHTFVSWLLESGEYSLEGIAILIGDNIDQVIKTYGHLANRSLVNAKARRAMAIRHGEQIPAPAAPPAASNVVQVNFRRAS